MIHRVLLSAIVAGFIAGIFVSVFQMEKVHPLILQAELYENTEVSAGDSGETESNVDAIEFAKQLAEINAWAPEDGIERYIYSFGSNIVIGVGFGLLMVSAFLFRGRPVNGTQGLLWGFAGFMVFNLAPGLGLPAELPGMAAADLEGRQSWWLMTAGATALGLGLLAFTKTWLWRVAGILFLALPHVIGAPHPEEFWGEVPPELAALFVMASIVSNLIFWSALGAAAGWIWGKLEKEV